MNNLFETLKHRHNNAYYGHTPIIYAICLHEIFEFNLFEEIQFTPVVANSPAAFTIHKQDIEEGGKFYDYRNYTLLKMKREFSCSVALA